MAASGAAEPPTQVNADAVPEPGALSSRGASMASMRARTAGELIEESVERAKEAKDKRMREARWSDHHTVQIFIGVVIGGSFGYLMQEAGYAGTGVAKVLSTPGELWLKALNAVVLPFIPLAMVEVSVMMRTFQGAERVGSWAIGLYVFTTTMAAVVGSFTSGLFFNGHLLDLNYTIDYEYPGAPNATELSTTALFVELVENIIPGNLVLDPMENNMMPVIIAALAFGLLVDLEGPDGEYSKAIQAAKDAYAVCIQVLSMIMEWAVLGAGSTVFASMLTLDWSRTSNDLILFGAVIFTGLGLQALVFYPLMIFIGGMRNPITYISNMMPAIGVAFGTSSSLMALPSSMECARYNGVSEVVSKFVLAVGASLNMDGTCIHVISCVAFLGFLQGITLTLMDWVALVIISCFISAGAAAIPSASLVLIAAALQAVHIPLNPHHFGVIVAADWLFDRMRSAVNVAGDGAVVAVAGLWFQDMISEGYELSSDRRLLVGGSSDKKPVKLR